MYIVKPMEIEKRSFEIISMELGSSGERFSECELLVLKRVIHTTADFEYADLLEFKNGAIEAGLEAIMGGGKIYCDTKMIVNGLNTSFLSKYGLTPYTLISDTDVEEDAKRRGITRAIAGMERAISNGETEIFIIGNAPTALFTLIEAVKAGKIRPKLIIGVPVGFVGAAESKAELDGVDVPYIRVNGRKGGSTVAVAILHGIAYQLGKRE
jgi:precorrin-8X/cobalt-precorrin-8 methylmutase